MRSSYKPPGDFIAALLLSISVLILFTVSVRADTKTCPRTEGACQIDIRASLSPSATHVCLFAEGETPALEIGSCEPTSPGQELTFERVISPGDGDRILYAYAYRPPDDQGSPELFSSMSEDGVRLLDLSSPVILRVRVSVEVQLE